MLLTAGLSSEYVMAYQRKTPRGGLGPYTKLGDVPGDLSSKYMAAYDKLRIFKTNERTERLETAIQSLQGENRELKTRLAELEHTGERAMKLEMLLEDPDVYQAFVETLQRLKERKT